MMVVLDCGRFTVSVFVGFNSVVLLFDLIVVVILLCVFYFLFIFVGVLLMFYFGLVVLFEDVVCC